MSIGDELYKIKDWCSQKNLFYLKADMMLPKETIDEAWKIYEMGLFVPHRINDGRGWKSCTLHGEEWNVTGFNEDKSNYKWTKITELAPIMTEWLKDVFPNNGKYSRCRFMLLEPGGFIRKHTDTHKWWEGMPLKNDVFSAINMCFNQPENCYLRNAETLEEVPFSPREIYFFNNGHFHEASNFSKEPRIHFIVHGGTNKERIEMAVRSFKKEYPDAVI